MDIAIVTGAASGVGLAIARKLIETGFRVYGLGGNYAECPFNHNDFIPLNCNLADPHEVETQAAVVLEREGNVLVVVNNAKVYSARPFSDISGNDIDTIVRINLLTPLLLTRAVLPSLVRLAGHVINIAPDAAGNARGGVTGAATGGGLRWMGQALFEELRESGVKVTTLFPFANTDRPDDAGKPDPRQPQSVIDPEMIARAVQNVVTHRDGNVITELVIRPQRLKERPLPEAYEVPYPAVESLGRARKPDTAQLDKTRKQVSDALERSRERSRRKPEPRSKPKPEPEERDAGSGKPHRGQPSDETASSGRSDDDEGDSRDGGRSRRRRRGGRRRRGRGDDNDGSGTDEGTHSQESSRKSGGKPDGGDRPPKKTEPAAAKPADAAEKPKREDSRAGSETPKPANEPSRGPRSRRNRRRSAPPLTPPPSPIEEKPSARESSPTPGPAPAASTDRPREDGHPATDAGGEKPATRKAPRKRAAKKAAARKTTTKKAPAKKAARKATRKGTAKKAAPRKRAAKKAAGQDSGS